MPDTMKSRDPSGRTSTTPDGRAAMSGTNLLGPTRASGKERSRAARPSGARARSGDPPAQAVAKSAETRKPLELRQKARPIFSSVANSRHTRVAPLSRGPWILALRGPRLRCVNFEDEILRLKRERNAVILAHYYQESDIQDVADFLGDSLQLAQEAKRTKADVILFAGVHFMAETAKILNPDKIVIVPDLDAGCSLADGCPADRFRAWRARHEGAVAITYINCSAAVKAESDYICTSSNAEKIVRAVPEDKEILFAPDKNLCAYLQKKIGRKMTLWQGSCIVHETFSERKLVGLFERHPDAELIAHPEC